MSNRITEKKAAEDAAADQGQALSPLDSWLRRELQSYYAESGSHELPAELAELAWRLEEKLRTAQDDAPEEDHPQSQRTSPRERGDS